MRADADDDRRPLSLRTQRALVLVPVAVAIGVVALFWLLRDLPPNWDCGDAEPYGQRARLDAYRSGFEVLHALVALGAAVAIVRLHGERRRRAGATGFGRPAFAGLVLALALAYPLAVAGAIALSLVGNPLGARPAAVLGILALAAAGVHAARRAGEGRVAGLAVAWAILLLTPGVAFLVRLQGDGPIVC